MDNTNNTLSSVNKEKISLLLALTQIDNDNAILNHKIVKRESGLYHFAILLPERKDLAAFLRHMQKKS